MCRSTTISCCCGGSSRASTARATSCRRALRRAAPGSPVMARSGSTRPGRPATPRRSARRPRSRRRWMAGGDADERDRGAGPRAAGVSARPPRAGRARAPLSVAAPVVKALRARRAVVALETTLVTHGLPHPEGLAAALALEAEVTAAGAQPATIGVLEGRALVGLTRAELERLAGTRAVAKLNLSNLGARIASRGAGSTTVAATIQIAALAGITVLATGGLGGVHRGAAESGDVSSDLT